MNQLLQVEAGQLHDIVQESFYENYNNLTLKSAMVFKWSAKYCSTARVFMKVDDDVFVFTSIVKEFLTEKLTLNPTLNNTFLCIFHKNAPSVRNPGDK